PEEMAPTRKPRTGMLSKYIENTDFDLENSFVIGDRLTDVELAANLGCKAIFINNDENLGSEEILLNEKALEKNIALKTLSWQDIYNFLKSNTRRASVTRKTNETAVMITLNLDGTG